MSRGPLRKDALVGIAGGSVRRDARSVEPGRGGLLKVVDIAHVRAVPTLHGMGWHDSDGCGRQRSKQGRQGGRGGRVCTGAAGTGRWALSTAASEPGTALLSPRGLGGMGEQKHVLWRSIFVQEEARVGHARNLCRVGGGGGNGSCPVVAVQESGEAACRAAGDDNVGCLVHAAISQDRFDFGIQDGTA